MAQFAAAATAAVASGAGERSARYQSPLLKAALERALKRRASASEKVTRMRPVISAHGRDLRARFRAPYRMCVPRAIHRPSVALSKRNWPESARTRRRGTFRTGRKHHPSGTGVEIDAPEKKLIPPEN